MPNFKTIKTSFGGGEISPELFGRLDLPKEQEGLAVCKNMWVLPHGPVQNRPGFKFVHAAQFATKKCRLIPFVYSNDQSFAIELGEKYLRFHALGGTLKDNLITNGGFSTSAAGWVLFAKTLWSAGKLLVSGYATELLTGGNFYPTITWTIYVTGTGTSITRVSTGPTSGKVKIVQAHDGDAAHIYKTMATVIGETYVVEAVISGRPCRVGIGSSRTLHENYNAEAPVGAFRHVFTATMTSTVVDFYGRTTAGTGYVSDVTARATKSYVEQNFQTAQSQPHTLTVNTTKAINYTVFEAVDNVDRGGSAITSGTMPAGLTTISFTSGATDYTRIQFINADLIDFEYTLESVFCNSESNVTPFQLASDYLESDLADIKYAQSGDIVTLVHPSYPPQELKRWDNSEWTLTPIVFESKTPAPTGVTVVATGSGGREHRYVVTALNAQGYEESPASTSVAVTNDLTTTGNKNQISWAVVTGAVRYNVYKYANGAYGYIGQTALLTFKDDNILADLTRTPALFDEIFTGEGNYPGSVGYYQQRRWFAGSNKEPQNIWGTQAATESNMGYSIPSRDSDALRFRVASQRTSQIRHILAMAEMILLTASGEYRVFSAQEALTPSTLTVKPQSQNGSSNVAPIIVNNSAIFIQAQGNHLRDMAYQWQANGYQSKDLCLMAPHFFKGTTIIDMAFTRTPNQTIWCVLDTGLLLGLTYLPDQEVLAWHQHDTDGQFESICSVTEGIHDVLYAVVKRTIGGQEKRYIEYLTTREFTTLADAFFVDSGLTYTGSPSTTITGLDHLEGKWVSVLADGRVQTPKQVTGGAITLDVAASKVQAGLPIDAYIETVPLGLAGDSSIGQGHVKNINAVWVRCVDFVGAKVGAKLDKLTTLKPIRLDQDGFPVLANGEIKIVLLSDWNQEGSVIISQPNPLPITITNLTIEAAIGG